MVDYYEVLEISRTASIDEIKQAYKILALRHHPDRHQGLNEDDKKIEEEKFKLINEAFEVLSDPVKRKKYDFSGREGKFLFIFFFVN